MSGRSQNRRKSRPRSVVVIAGEDRNDRESLKTLLEKEEPSLRGSIVQIRDTVRLHRATGDNLAKRVRAVLNKAEGVAEKQGPGTRVTCLYVHEDFDAVDGPAYREAHRRVEEEIRRQMGHGHYVLAVAEMEAWMLLFPGALSSVVRAWKVPSKYLGKDTGRFSDPKRILMREVSGTGRKYTESDAPEVFRAVVEGGHMGSPRGTNSSWTRFRWDVELCGREHL
ncbi:DUF4276 family protein [Nocardiopsis sp. CNT312]|uniref:DUF4276 family protein n=1 Tax=Nocardiopsis sp. CNT312 TaxID=1137268 RepID=UPI001E4FE818|nr:DUF4276 family protein [Nocardiopsis sp. CNT312]